MKKYLVILAVCFAFVGTALAHNGMEHVMGTVNSVNATNITVKAADGKIQSVALTATTKYSRNKHPVTLQEIKVGDRIVIHATKKDNMLTAVEVEVGASMSGDMKGMKM